MRARLMAAARDLFLAQGYAATGVDQICSLAGVTKGALFHYFSGKQSLAAAVIDDWARAALEARAQAAFQHAPTAVERALGYVDFAAEMARRATPGSLIGTLAQELSAAHPELRRQCQGAFRAWSDELAALLEEARREAGGPRFDSASVADHFVAVFEGAQILAKARRSNAVLEEHLRHFRAYLEILLGLPPADPTRARVPAAGPRRDRRGKKRS